MKKLLCLALLVSAGSIYSESISANNKPTDNKSGNNSKDITMVDLVRKNLFEKSYMRIIDKYSVSWLKIFREIYNFFERKIFG